MVRLRDTVERTMFYGAKPRTFESAKELRNIQTEAEKVLWEVLKKNQMLGLRFKNQNPINIFIADFYCHTLKLVIEVDGESHLTKEGQEYDENRTAELNSFGIRVIRFKNEEVLNNIDRVRNEIEGVCRRMLGR